jgi:hypothetical protein
LAKYVLLILVFILSFLQGISQLVLVKGNKQVKIDTNKILGFNSSTVVVASVYDYTRKSSSIVPVVSTDSIRGVFFKGNNMTAIARTFICYVDSFSGQHYTPAERQQLYLKGYNKMFPIFKDTTVTTPLDNISSITLKTREYRRGGDGMGIFGMFVMGTGVTIFSTVTVIKGNNNGFYGLGLGALMLGLTRHWIKQAQWFKRYEISNKKWRIKHS